MAQPKKEEVSMDSSVVLGFLILGVATTLLWIRGWKHYAFIPLGGYFLLVMIITSAGLDQASTQQVVNKIVFLYFASVIGGLIWIPKTLKEKLARKKEGN